MKKNLIRLYKFNKVRFKETLKVKLCYRIYACRLEFILYPLQRVKSHQTKQPALLTIE